MTYEERLRLLEIPTLEERRERGDLINVYRMVNGMENVDREAFLTLDTRRTRGHSMKLKKDVCRRDIKKYSFPHRIVNKWNELSEEIVKAKTVHAFKRKLDNKYRDWIP